MLELISLICALVLVVWTPQEVNKVLGGWVNKRFKGDHAAFLKAYRKQLSVMRGAGMAFVVAMLAIAALEFADEGDATRGAVKLVAAVIWGGVAIVSHRARQKLDAAIAAGSIPTAPPAVPATPAPPPATT